MKLTHLAALAALAMTMTASGVVVAHETPSKASAAGDKKCKLGKGKTFVVNNDDVGVPVFPYDITDRKYTVIGEVQAGVRKATIFSHEASQTKIYCELWERAVAMGADAVINAKYGDSHVTAMSWGKTNATGTAIKFVQ